MFLKLIILSLYFLILLGIGFFASKRVSNISDYYVGGKKLGYWIAAPFCSVIILYIFQNDYIEKHAIAFIITGLLCIPFFKFVVPNISTLEPYINKLDVMLPSVVLAMLAGWATSTFLKD